MEIMLGTVQFGLNYGISNTLGKVSDLELSKILKVSEENNINFLDTASMYGDSEKRIGVFLGGKNKFQIVTKTPHLNERSSQFISDTFVRSLEHLKQKRLYSLMFHRADDLLTDLGEGHYKVLHKLKAQGSISKIGCSVYSPEQLIQIKTNFDIDLFQFPLNIFDQRFLQGDLLDELKNKNIELHARSLFLQGLVFILPEKLNSYFNPIKGLLTRFHKRIQEQDLSPLQASHSFIKGCSQIDKVLIGVVSEEQLKENIEIFDNASAINFSEFSLSEEKFINPALWEVSK